MNKEQKIQKIDDLLNNYYNGLTSVAEEKILRKMLSANGLPARFEADKAIFGYFASQKTNNKAKVITFVKWIDVAAAVFATLVIIGSHIDVGRSNYAYINGKKVTDIETLHANAIASIRELDPSTDEVRKSAELLNDDEEIMKQQLSQFSDF